MRNISKLLLVFSILILSVIITNASTQNQDNIYNRRIIVRLEDGVSEDFYFPHTIKKEVPTELKKRSLILLEIQETANYHKVLESINNHKYVKYAHPDYIIDNPLDKMNIDGFLNIKWHLEAIRYYESLEIIDGEYQCTIAVLDTGFSTQREEILDRVLEGKNFVQELQQPLDDNGHGSAVTNIIMEIDPTAKILPIKVLNEEGKGSVSNFISGIYYAIDNNVDIINMSLGTKIKGEAQLEAILEAYKNDILVVAASGNSGNNDKYYPASYKTTISVSSINKNTESSIFSSTGNFVSVTAPGEEIVTLNNFDMEAVVRGTSMSTGIVTGVLSKLKRVYPHFSSDELRYLLEKGANSITEEKWNEKFGYGIVSLYSSLSVNLPDRSEDISDFMDDAYVLEFNESKTSKIDFLMDKDWYLFNVDKPEVLKIFIDNQSVYNKLVAELHYYVDDELIDKYIIDHSSRGENIEYVLDAREGQYYVLIYDYYNNWSNESYTITVSSPVNSSIQNMDEVEDFSIASIISIDRTRNIDSIVEKSKELNHSGFNVHKTTRYETAPNFTYPYEAGSLDSNDIEDALNTLKMIRYIAGLPYEDIEFKDELNYLAQHGAVLLAASNQFSHHPQKPSDMDDSFYNIGYLACSQSNISYGRSNISNSILAFVADGGENNIEKAGHRRWILRPGGQNFGIGFAKNTQEGNHRSRILMHVFDGLGPFNSEVDTYIAWPSPGDFPIQYFISSANINTSPRYPWSINVGSNFKVPVRKDINLTLTRHRDNKVWTFNDSTPQLGMGNMPDSSMHLSVDNDGYGMRKAIIFRPDVTTLGDIKDGDVFTVKVTGLKYLDENPASITYTINFFDLESELDKSRVNITVKDKDAFIEGATVTIDGKEIITDENGLATIRLSNNKTYSYTITKPGYIIETDSISVETSEISKVNTIIKVQPSPQPVSSGSNFDSNVTVNHVQTSLSHFNVTFKVDGYEDIVIRAVENKIDNIPDIPYKAGYIGKWDYDDFFNIQRDIIVNAIYYLNEEKIDEKDSLDESREDILKVKSFNDMKGHWSEELVMDLFKRGIISGYDDGSIRPDSNITRAEAAVLIALALELEPDDILETNFEDDADLPKWAKGYIKIINQNGIIRGYPDNTFRHNDRLTRQELVVMVVNAFNFKSPPKDLNFNDKDDIGHWAKDAIGIAVYLEIISGYTDNTLKPANSITRAETFSILANALRANE
ncbi:UNVERIFIED_CONTAM: Subtilisin-like serine proteases [Acetivibrio alkalicellulosi]